MFSLPTHTIFLVKHDGTKCNMMSTDCSTKEMVKHEVNYLFTKCGYKKEDYVKAQYTRIINGKEVVLYEFNISELED